MTEEFLHYIWRFGLFYPLRTDNLQGANLEVINPGRLNTDSGPDFFNAMIRIGTTLMAGNIELHINASDWYRHGHHFNKAYDSVILQLVINKDAEIRRTNGEIIPTVEIQFDKNLLANYSKLLRKESWIPCKSHISRIDKSILTEWLNVLAIRRLEQKALILKGVMLLNQNSWEESFYQQLARNFGFGLNGTVFEMLARSLPYRIIQRHRDNLFQLEAFLFGQAGLLSVEPGDEYYESLKREYCFLKNKYRLKPLDTHLWRFLRLRPANFPTIRIAQFASFLNRTPCIFSTVLDTGELNRMAEIFRVKASEYWDKHFVFNKPSIRCPKTTGNFALHSILINTVAPFLYFYGKQRDIARIRERALYFMKELPAETNITITGWSGLGVRANNAFSSQALLHLKNEYCSHLRCLECPVGSKIIVRDEISLGDSALNF